MILTAQKIASPSKTSLYVIFNRSGERVGSPNEKAVCAVAKQADAHYLQWNKIDFKKILKGKNGLGIGAVVALFEAVTAVALAILERSPATFTNAATTFSECIQVFIANIAPKYKELSENIMAGVISIAGVSGFYKWAKDMIDLVRGKGENLQDLPLWQKTSLSIASLVSSAMMFLGWSEKNSLAPLAKDENGGFKGKEMRLNGSSDMRCSFEWLMMVVFPWFKQFKVFKIPVDLILPLLAMQDGLGHFVEKAVKNSEGKFINALKKVFNMDDSTSEQKIGVPSLFFKPWFFGRKEGEGFRARLLPLYKYFGCEDPVICHMNENSELVVRVPEAESLLYEASLYSVESSPASDFFPMVRRQGKLDTM